jgi:hypothetical protein
VCSSDLSELVQIYSPTGSLMYSGKGTEISVESFASGMYIIQAEGYSPTRFIKQ